MHLFPICLTDSQISMIHKGYFIIPMEVQPERVIDNTIAYAKSECMIDDLFDDLYEIVPPFNYGEKIVMIVDEHKTYIGHGDYDIEQETESITITNVEALEVDGQWVWKMHIN